MSEKHRFHFTGICGTAMGAVAAAMKQRGFKVSGSDANVYPPMSDFLRREGIALTEGYRAENIPADAEVIVIGLSGTDFSGGVAVLLWVVTLLMLAIVS